MAKKAEPITVKDWGKGIAQNPYAGFPDMRCVNINAIPGLVMPNIKTFASYPPAVDDKTFTADASTDKITVSNDYEYSVNNATTNGTGRPVTVSSTDTLPAGLSADTIYYLIDLDAVGNDEYQLATTYANAIAGTQIDITDAGTGTHTISTVNLNSVAYQTHDKENDKYYILDTSGRIWQIDSSKGLIHITEPATLGSGEGIIAWKDYLFVFRDAKVDVYGPLSGSPSWTDDWETGLVKTTSHDHYAHTAQNDLIYFCNGASGIGSIQEDTTFDPSSGATYTVNASALDLPEGVFARRLEELGGNLMIGTNEAIIYPWDTFSDSFNDPIILNERNCDGLVTVNNLMYIFTGRKGNIYRTDGTNWQKISKIPEYMSEYFSPTQPTVEWGKGNPVRHNEKIFFGVSCIGCSGLWSLDTSAAVLVLENIISNGSYGVDSSTKVIMGAPMSDGENIYYGWLDEDGSLKGWDRSLRSRIYSNFESVIISPMLMVGTKNHPLNLSNLETLLDKALGATSEGVRISYRTNKGGSWTVLGTFNEVGKFNFIEEIGHVTVVNIQLKIELDGTTAGAGVVPRLKEVRLWPM